MNDIEDFAKWVDEIYMIFWATGRFWNANSDFLTFMYEDDATPNEVAETVLNALGY